MPFDGESGEIGADKVFSMHLLGEDRSCFFGEVEADRSWRKGFVVDDDGERFRSRCHWRRGGSGRMTATPFVRGSSSRVVDWGSCAPFEGGSPSTGRAGGNCPLLGVARDDLSPSFPLFPLLLQVPSRHVEEGFGFVYHVVGDRLVLYWRGGGERRRGRGSWFEGDNGGVGAEGGDGDWTLGLGSEDLWWSWRESGVPHLIGVVLEGDGIWRSNEAF